MTGWPGDMTGWSGDMTGWSGNTTGSPSLPAFSVRLVSPLPAACKRLEKAFPF